MSESRAAYMREYRAKRAASLSDNGLLPFQLHSHSWMRFAG